MRIKKLEISNAWSNLEGRFWVSLDSMQDLNLALTTEEVATIEKTLEPILSSILENRLLGIAKKVEENQPKEKRSIWKLGH